MPIFGYHLEMLLNAMLEFYHKHFNFMINFWQCLGRISSLVDKYQPGNDDMI